MPGKNNQWEDVDNQGGRWVEKKKEMVLKFQKDQFSK